MHNYFERSTAVSAHSTSDLQLSTTNAIDVMSIRICGRVVAELYAYIAELSRSLRKTEYDQEGAQQSAWYLRCTEEGIRYELGESNISQEEADWYRGNSKHYLANRRPTTLNEYIRVLDRMMYKIWHLDGIEIEDPKA